MNSNTAGRDSSATQKQKAYVYSVGELSAGDVPLAPIGFGKQARTPATTRHQAPDVNSTVM